MKRQSRVAAALIAAALIAPASGCAAIITPQATEHKYAAGDGAATSLGDIDVRGVMVVTQGKGKPGQLLASFFNSSNSAKTVKLSTQSFSTTVRVKPNGKVKLNPKDGKNVVIPSVSTKPGELLKMSVSSGSTTKHFNSQVFNGALPQYKKYLPSPQAGKQGKKSGQAGGQSQTNP